MPAPREPPAEAGPFAALDPLPPGDLVAVGGSLDPALVLSAYRHGVFPWGRSGRNRLWWSPDPRALLPLGGLRLSRRMRRTLCDRRWSVTLDADFEAVVDGCARGRPEGTWIDPPLKACFLALHRLGHAHSLEVRWEGQLAGGVYGVSVGALFAAESMFHRRRDASKVALAHLDRVLCAGGYEGLDVQFETPHLSRLGAYAVPRAEYLARLAAWRGRPARFGPLG